ncbi:MAG: hypothetical protein HDT21_06790 [Ruminococcus sp.]|nr:hypothetical protein [Ruminococcus sp.]
MKTVHRTVFKSNLVAYRNKEGRSCSPLLETALAVSHLLLRFGRICACGRGEGSFALCGARPKAPPLDFASWAQLDQLMSAASPPKICYMMRKIKIYC